MREGRKEGLLLGKAEGIAIGKAEGERALVRRVERKRFGEPSAIAENEIASITDLMRLESLADRLLEVETWDKLLTAAV